MLTQQTVKRRGRPPAFNRDEALENAMQIFWEHGYEGTSMSELMEAMDMNKPSIYAAFGNKEELFRKALQKYLSGPSAFVKDAVSEPTARQVVKVLLTKAVELMTAQSTPRGCMIVQGALSCGAESKLIQQELISYRSSFEESLKERFELAKTNSDLPKDANTATLAKYVAIIHQGISVQATSGATKEDLMAVIDIVMKNWLVSN
ncbi:HTH-type transcriptional repressor ComR [mine drainage metagenome]|uniref:HTH-type transcriptional repressor ComR n=1 Tax=mine drainage metagenome TaxID=410659 RepID=A0A1J5S3G5_9ZZZZ